MGEHLGLPMGQSEFQRGDILADGLRSCGVSSMSQSLTGRLPVSVTKKAACTMFRGWLIPHLYLAR
jgi:hypothetical protein